MLQERLVTVAREQEEEGAAVRHVCSVLQGYDVALNVVAMVAGAAPAGRGAAARTGEAAAARGVDTGEATDGEGAGFAQGEGPSRHQMMSAVVVAALESATCCSLCPRPVVLLQLVHVSALEAEISSMTLKLQWSEDDKTRLLRETEEQSNKVTSLKIKFSFKAHLCCSLWGQQCHTRSRSELSWCFTTGLSCYW